jgi:hypothetical protein
MPTTVRLWQAPAEPFGIGRPAIVPTALPLQIALPRMTASTTSYRSFIVRIWRERDLERPEMMATNWQSEAECIQTGERRSFSNLDELLLFLRHQTEDRDTRVVPTRD